MPGLPALGGNDDGFHPCDGFRLLCCCVRRNFVRLRQHGVGMCHFVSAQHQRRNHDRKCSGGDAGRLWRSDVKKVFHDVLDKVKVVDVNLPW